MCKKKKKHDKKKFTSGLTADMPAKHNGDLLADLDARQSPLLRRSGDCESDQASAGAFVLQIMICVCVMWISGVIW